MTFRNHYRDDTPIMGPRQRSHHQQALYQADGFGRSVREATDPSVPQAAD